MTLKGNNALWSANHAVLSVSELPGAGGWEDVEPLKCFLNPLTHCQIMFWEGQLYTVYIGFTS